MRIDFHTYIGHWPFRQLRGNTPAGLVEYMGRFGIDQAVVANINGVFYKNTQPANEELAEAIKPFPGRFIPYAVINPTYPDWEYDLEVCHRQARDERPAAISPVPRLQAHRPRAWRNCWSGHAA